MTETPYASSRIERANLSGIERWILELLRVPADPEPPEGSANSLRVFRAGRNFYFFQLAGWALVNIGLLVLLLSLDYAGTRILANARVPDWVPVAWFVLVALEILAFLATLPVTFIAQRLNYLLRWYIVTDHSLRIRTGIFSMQELTMTFANIQEIRVSANPLQNLLAIADVQVQSAGGGSGSDGASSGHIGRFQGVANANEIRDLMVERLRQYRDGGLGESVKSTDGVDETSAALAVLSAAKALRTAFENRAN